ncbi:hypothetical protein GCM10010168_30440 [Actinoplanes ianthinogenes]|uniref:Uncharacterized protein n=1 Tax=Actinoplanes ianthinogenes TaxID=122358 RepID=A0ABM7LLQ0_9ACTN|nr:hypothetical protein Aiant_08430 [Actinoplanes ianthinogenes]GGR10831.1 hypothetical protein GCM10010168_30440 [Actinoplanes ianthinogenes]
MLPGLAGCGLPEKSDLGGDWAADSKRVRAGSDWGHRLAVTGGRSHNQRRRGLARRPRPPTAWPGTPTPTNDGMAWHADPDQRRHGLACRPRPAAGRDRRR